MDDSASVPSHNWLESIMSVAARDGVNIIVGEDEYDDEYDEYDDDDSKCGENEYDDEYDDDEYDDDHCDGW